MNVRRINLLLQITMVILLAAALVSIAAGLILPLELSKAVEPLPVAMVTANHGRSLPPVNSFSPLFARSLQTGLTGSVTLARVQPDSPSPQAGVPISQLVLVGTIGDSLALIKGPDGSVAMIETGDDVEGSLVVAIRTSQVDLRVDGKVTTLRMATAPDDRAVLQIK